MIPSRLVGKHIKMGDPQLALSDADLRKRGALMRDTRLAPNASQARVKTASRMLGCQNENPFSALQYLDLSCLFPVPIGHTLLFGVLRDFVDFLLRKEMEPVALTITSSARKHIEGRGAAIMVTSDFGRRYKCILRYR